MLRQLFLMVVFQFVGIAFTSCIQENYKLPARLNSVLRMVHDLKLPEQSIKLSKKLTFLSEKRDRYTGLLSINICLLYHKKLD